MRKNGKYEMSKETTQRQLTVDDYLRAASIIATCKKECLPCVQRVLELAGIDTSLPHSEPKDQLPCGKSNDTFNTANNINRAHKEYGIPITVIAREAGLNPQQLYGILKGSVPTPERASAINSAIFRLFGKITAGPKKE